MARTSIARRAASVGGFALLLAAATGCLAARPSEERLDALTMPAGFSIEIWAEVPNARSLTRGPEGVVFVGSRGAGAVHAVVDADGDRRVDRVLTLASGLMMPNGVAYRDGSLYVAEVDKVIRFDGIEGWLAEPKGTPKVGAVFEHFPSERHHGWKFIAFGPDGLLYVPVGAPCNVCDEGDPYATIMRMKPDGTDLEVFARGVRNTVGFTWHPGTGAMWFTDNGRDWMGDDSPPDELNRAEKEGLHFGFPYCHGGTIPDPEFGSARPCSELTPPAARLGPHVAALGLRFYDGAMFPADYRGHLLIAEHGSWNRTTPIGYRITQVRVESRRAVSYEPFIEGWLQGSKAWGRPVDVLVMPDGSLLISDDQAGVVYRVTYTAPEPSPAPTSEEAKIGKE